MNLENQINIEISSDILNGQFANLAIVSHSHAEFILDFIVFLPGMTKGRIISRIILTPFQAKRLSIILGEQIKKFESTFGTIRESEFPSEPSNSKIPPFSVNA